jgi:hypothetical protein
LLQLVEILTRRAEKLALSLKLGLKQTVAHDIVFLSELTAEEAMMSPVRWEKFLEDGNNRKPIVKPSSPPEPRRCILGKDCHMATRRQPAVIEGSGLYCSSVCRGRAAKRRQKAILDVENRSN